jgi:predicted transcriptional regulator
LNLTPKQYYSRLSALSKNALVKKYEGKLRLTSFGKLVYDAQYTIEKGLRDLVSSK